MNYLGFVWRQWTIKPRPLPPTLSLQGKTALITGANSGLGLEAARALVSRRLSRLIIAVRDVSKGEAAKTEILSSPDASPTCKIDVWPLDHESYESIAQFGKKVDELDRLDYVLLNAGVKIMKYEKTLQGHETNVQINHIGTSAVSLAVLPALRRTARNLNTPTRLTIVSSEGHFWIPFKERNAENILARMDDPKTFEQGGNCLVDALVQHEGSHGAYLSDQRETRPSPFVVSDEGEKAQKKIWEETIALLEKEATGVNVSLA
ncbi:hypothetical protein GRF29_185g601297 [Pseudopithomyces chartarum]|uniref:NAD(P)-binding protein n=1 Tax=Pseudopithomyces chartarum TaxID=1892770 RepID=A0AAN6LNY3_9PLEO|nr:hypothetical protein GRF29_185g601297 [Pseudopithomyces chartarum]